MMACAATQPDIGAKAHHRPFTAAAGMELAQLDHIPQPQFEHHAFLPFPLRLCYHSHGTPVYHLPHEENTFFVSID
jgi:hypothetical protein